jgi:hypothetical protein
MGQTKKLYEEMELNELMSHFFTHEEDEDYWYQRHQEEKQRTEAEYSAMQENYSHGL